MKESQPKKRTSRLFFIVGSGVISFLVLLWALNTYILDRPSFCTSCHLIQSAYDSWQKSQHKPEFTKNSCNACHVEPGLLGSLKASFYGLENTYIFFFGLDEDDIKATRPVYCTQKGCHAQIRDSDEGKRVRVNHGLHMDMGYSCVICHDRVAHEEYAMAKNISMMQDFCYACHNDEVAPRNDCRVCHIYQDRLLNGKNVPEGLAALPSPHLAKKVICQDCHLTFKEPAEKSCLNCHREETVAQYQQTKTLFEQRLSKLKAELDEVKTLFDQIKGYGPTWEQALASFQKIEKNYLYLGQDSNGAAHNPKLTEFMLTSLEKDMQRVRYFLYSYQRYSS